MVLGYSEPASILQTVEAILFATHKHQQHRGRNETETLETTRQCSKDVKGQASTHSAEMATTREKRKRGKPLGLWNRTTEKDMKMASKVWNEIGWSAHSQDAWRLMLRPGQRLLMMMILLFVDTAVLYSDHIPLSTSGAAHWSYPTISVQILHRGHVSLSVFK